MTNPEHFTYSTLPQPCVAPPGYALADLIDHKRMSDGDVVVLCAQLGISARDLCRLLVGRLPVDETLAMRLGRWFGAPSAKQWLEMEAAYREVGGDGYMSTMAAERSVA